jgi:hypothetical protein
MSALDPLRAAGAALSRVIERWVPDSRVIGMILTAIARTPEQAPALLPRPLEQPEPPAFCTRAAMALIPLRL